MNLRHRPHPRHAGEPTALVLSTQYRSGPWCVRALRDAGFRTIGAERTGHTPGQGRSMACPNPVRYPSPATRPTAFLEWLEDICAQQGVDVVLPNSEDAVRVIAHGAPNLSGAVVAGPDAPQYIALCDKAGLAASAQAVGAGHPATVVVTDPGGHPALPSAPVIVKAALSGESLKEDLGTVLAHSDADRDDAVAHMLAAGSPALVQEFVTGVPWVVHGVRTRSGRLVVVAARVATTYPRTVGVSSISTSVPCPPRLLEDTRRLLSHVAYVGPFCTNAIERDGAFFTHDINLRVAASVGLAVSAGLDVPGLGARAALGQQVDFPDERREVTYLRLDGEARALMDAIHGGGDVRSVLGDGLAALPGHRVLDPNPFDPLFMGITTGRALRKALRR
ncbi:MAG: hypothetical protein U0Y82_09585 [Thermoleophilia bacterium]